MSHSPQISVVLPVYNGAAFLKEAVESILNQTYTDFEFIIVNDGSKDNSEEIIRSFSDPRIRYQYQQNQGLGATLNNACAMSRGKYIARQDQDDISLPERFKKQVDFLEQNSDVELLGTWAKIISDNQGYTGFHKHQAQPAALQFDLLFDNPFVHSSVMFRKDAFEKAGHYNPDRNLYEDYNLWSKMAAAGKVANLPEVLLLYRHHEAGMSKNFSNFKELALYNQGVENLKVLLGKTDDALADLVAIYHWKDKVYKGSSPVQLRQALKRISNEITRRFPGNDKIVLRREKFYWRIISYRLKVLERKKDGVNLILKMKYKLQNIIFELESRLFND